MKKNRNPRGQAFVEFALVLPILLVMVYGLFEVGRMIFIYTTVVSASREAARYAAAVGRNNAGIPRFQDCAGMRAAAQRVGIMAGIRDEDVVISHDSGGGGGVVYCAGTIDPSFVPEPDNSSRVIVQVTGHFTPVVPLPFVPIGGFDITAVSRRTVIAYVELEPTY